jgi:hypothetical protein
MVAYVQGMKSMVSMTEREREMVTACALELPMRRTPLFLGNS